MDTYNHKQLFQSTLPQGERRKAGSPHGIYTGYFNPRSHKGSDCSVYTIHNIKSNFNPRSHKGSDAVTATENDIIFISIHAPTRGATLPSEELITSVTISIHAPTRGATRAFRSNVLFGYFNPRSHKGSDAPCRFCGQMVQIISIHAPTRGATSANVRIRWWSMNFNPRSHKGSDHHTPRTI